MDNTQTNSRKVLQQLHSLIKAIDDAGEQILRHEIGLGFSQFKILAALQDNPQSSQAAVAACLSLTPPAVSRHIDVLLQRGMVTRKVNPENRRQRKLCLTKQGEASLSESWDLLDSRFGEVLKILKPKEQEQLISALGKLSKRLG